ncbi:unnamed protein product, partial [Discosporangium mesarthrocarpum]
SQDLRAITGVATAAHDPGGGGGGGAPPGVIGEGGYPFVIQKFVKSRGPHAFIVRQACVLEYATRPIAWMISNHKGYGGDIDNEAGPTAAAATAAAMAAGGGVGGGGAGGRGGRGESLLLAGPALIGRFITTPSVVGACSMVPLSGAACRETAEAAGCLRQHLEAVLGRQLEVVVCDFTKDDRGRWWLLQIKAVRFRHCSPSHPFRL